MHSLNGADLAPYFALARATLAGLPPASPALPLPGDRVFITAWRAGAPPLRGTGLGATLAESVIAASAALAQQEGTAPGPGVRLEIDVLDAATPTTLKEPLREPVFDVGLGGYAASRGDGSTSIGWVLPGEILLGRDVDLGAFEKESVPLRVDKIRRALASRAGTSAESLGGWSVARFTVEAELEPLVTGQAPVPLVRGAPSHPTELSVASLLDSVRSAADYLARAVAPNGTFTYLYDPVAGTEDERTGYSMLRHAGAIYALMEAYEALGNDEWRQKALLAIGCLNAQIRHTAEGDTLFDGGEGEQEKAGGAGLALIALTKYAKVTGDLRALEEMRALGRFLSSRQYPDGHFRANADVAREGAGTGKPPVQEVPFFAGEATLGLARLEGVDPGGGWLAVARKGANYLVHVRDAKSAPGTQIHDQWLAYALRDLYDLTGDAGYAAHAQKIADAILLAERDRTRAPAPDFVGSFFTRGESTPSAVRLEALGSAWALARAAHLDEEKLRTPAMDLASFLRGEQLDADSVYFAREPARAIGGVRESLFEADVRIDYTQHALSGWLLLARLLREPVPESKAK